MCRSERITALGIFGAAAALFVLLRTRQYLAVDGAIRCLSVYWLGRPMAGGNNHLLYYVNVFVWMKTLSFAGLNAKSSFDFIRMIHWMNALAAAASVSMLWIFCRRASESAGTAWAAACAYAFSNAFLLHATSTAEPMVGLFWSFISVAMVASGLATCSRLRLFAGGALLLLAMATYESMVMVGPAELVLIYNWNERRSADRTAALSFLAGCISGGIIAYVPAYVLSGTTNPLEVLHRFFDIGGGEQVYGGFGASKLLRLPIGFANSIVPILPADYSGLRSLLSVRHDYRWLLLISTAVVASVSWLVWTARRLAFVWDALERRQRLILKCCAVALVFDIFPQVFWGPIYDKLWLQPLAVILLAWSVIFAAWYRLRRPRLMVLPEALLIAFIVIAGFIRAFEASRASTPCLDTAGQLAKTLRSSDLFVAEWDPVSLLYSSFWGGAKRFDVPSTATANGPKTLALLDDEISNAENSGDRVYFLGVLDMPEATWKPYLEDRCHLPYHSLDAMRQCAKPVAKLTCGRGDEVLWQLSKACYKP